MTLIVSFAARRGFGAVGPLFIYEAIWGRISIVILIVKCSGGLHCDISA